MPERGTSGNVSDLRPPWGDGGSRKRQCRDAHGNLYTACRMRSTKPGRDVLPAVNAQ